MEKLVLDPVACDGHGVCALFAPDLVDLDRFGYAYVKNDRPVTNSEKRQAKRACAACPKSALRLVATRMV